MTHGTLLQEYYPGLSFSKGDDGLGDPGVFVYLHNFYQEFLYKWKSKCKVKYVKKKKEKAK